ncbi:hypothetical protein RirG_252010 [Rhizophagus irregularis DAOM 197198w]|uniref:Uncharacterized protein n=1 Tax=Rhizophagus irregularis (strain DAOM 197198w) TaxID=1432141 RepID=A0A015IEY5_RHIIW|nr:hypothetical protein RirG_252010 [Rhizophagus irregularis DAOM 197198w]
MSNTQSNDSLRELNAKLLAEIGELRKKFAEIKVKNDELKDKNIKIPELRRKFAEIEIERTELKAKIAKLLKQGVKENKRHMLRMPSSRSGSRSWRKTRQILQLRMLGVMLRLLRLRLK